MMPAFVVILLVVLGHPVAALIVAIFYLAFG